LTNAANEIKCCDFLSSELGEGSPDRVVEAAAVGGDGDGVRPEVDAERSHGQFLGGGGQCYDFENIFAKTLANFHSRANQCITLFLRKCPFLPNIGQSRQKLGLLTSGANPTTSEFTTTTPALQ
jgi:hypothetical protein